MKIVRAARLSQQGPANRIITPASPEFPSNGILDNSRTIASGPWVSANDPVAVPFRLSEGCIVNQLGWVNGSGTMTDNMDVGVYDSAFVRLVSTGSTARSGVSAWQWVNVTDTALAPGKYFLCAANSGTTANQQTFFAPTTSAIAMSFMGCQDSSTDAFPLPNPLTNMALAATMTRIPVMGIATRAPF